MARPKKQSEVSIEVVTPEVITASDKKKTVFKVFGPNGFVREYSIEEHGEKAEEMARGFAGKYANHSVI